MIGQEFDRGLYGLCDKSLHPTFINNEVADAWCKAGGRILVRIGSENNVVPKTGDVLVGIPQPDTIQNLGTYSHWLVNGPNVCHHTYGYVHSEDGLLRSDDRNLPGFRLFMLAFISHFIAKTRDLSQYKLLTDERASGIGLPGFIDEETFEDFLTDGGRVYVKKGMNQDNPQPGDVLLAILDTPVTPYIDADWIGCAHSTVVCGCSGYCMEAADNDDPATKDARVRVDVDLLTLPGYTIVVPDFTEDDD